MVVYYIVPALFVILSVTYVFIKRKYSYWAKRGVPFPKPTFIFGNVGQAITLTSTLSTIVEDLYKKYEDHAYVGLYNFWTPAILVRDLDLAREVLIKNFKRFHDNWFEVDSTVDPAFAKNPFVIKGSRWKTIRNQLTGQFTKTKLKSLIPLMQHVGESLSEFVGARVKAGKPGCIEVLDLAARFSGESVLACAYGLKGNSFLEDTPVTFVIKSEILKGRLTTKLGQVVGLFFPVLRKLLNVTFIGNPVPPTFWRMILDAIKYREEHHVSRLDYLDFIRSLREAKQKLPYEMTDDYTVGHAFTFFLDGFETSGLAIAFTLYELALNTAVQDKSRAEINDVLEKHKGKSSYEAMMEMKYVNNVILESLRKHPVVTLINRVCTDKFSLFPPHSGGGRAEVIVEKGTQVIVPIFAIQHDPRYYPNPEQFDPDRSGLKKSLLSFGEGPRICLGKDYAILQIKMALVAILQRFSLRINGSTKVPYERDFIQALNVPKGGIFIEFYKI